MAVYHLTPRAEPVRLKNRKGAITMPEETTDAKRRTNIQDLPKPEKELTPEEAKDVKGGGVIIHDKTARGGILPYIEQDNLTKKNTPQ
jgi:hypothetical protein